MRSIRAILMAACLVVGLSARAEPIEVLQEVITSPTTFAVCKTVDVASTIHLLSTGAGVEANPITAALIQAGGFPALILVSVGLYFLVRQIENPVAIGVVNVATCGAAVNNVLLIKP